MESFLPNDEQVLGLTGASSLAAGAAALLELGTRCVAVTRGAEGALVVKPDETIEVPAYDVEVIDTTGCGDAFSAGFLRGLSLGHELGVAAALGCATAAQVAQGLGTDAGESRWRPSSTSRRTPARSPELSERACGFPRSRGKPSLPVRCKAREVTVS